MSCIIIPSVIDIMLHPAAAANYVVIVHIIFVTVGITADILAFLLK